ncbi:MAG: tripartite tricarboxylate transporter substrate binding protein [Pigmentiphaga sp.]|uniref:Bug family tripartite tricarboxylate transporter substrate binding protein n=1 Tax=Pigmentiphaga sp. TaxID=1977564 RepID=UPI0029BAE7A0|nr:tripartite tricarboxylate transporter substrate binding protein [Pigmentiphaga sp.]MDX3906567.1 tripartite tricarboxylate transporter substrate binding protein [Pigmentiphaga sp.]
MQIKKFLLAPLLAAISATATAQEYPSRPVEIIVPYSAGGSVDVMARAFSRELSDILSTQIVVNNRDGAGGTIGVAAVASARPDGYTVLFSPSSPLTQAPFLMGRLPYQTDSITPICQIFENPFVIAVRKDSPVKTLKELLEQARQQPGKLSYGHAGPGSVPHLATANLAKSAGVAFNEIAFRGDAQVIPQLLGGHIDFGALGVSSVVGKDLRILAVYGDKRLPGMPEVPAITEFGIKHAVIARNGLYVRQGVSQAARDKLQQACHAATEKTEFQTAARQLYQQVNYLDSATFATRLADDNQTNRALIESLGLLKSAN